MALALSSQRSCDDHRGSSHDRVHPAAELATQFADVPPTLIESTVRAAAVRPDDETVATEDIARADVAALAEVVRRSASASSR